MKQFWVIGLMLVLVSCDSCQHTKSSMPSDAEIRQELMQANKKKHLNEKDSIHAFVVHQGWPMIETNTGMYYQVLKKGDGAVIKNGDRVDVSFSVFLLDGTLCYQNVPANPVSFEVGQDHVETGLHQLMPMITEGSHVRVILPSHLAFGFTGDSQRIPGDSPLYYDLTVLRVR
jgi:FKBP-type peptidyl-prolyl cis-trans isomerase